MTGLALVTTQRVVTALPAWVIRWERDRTHHHVVQKMAECYVYETDINANAAEDFQRQTREARSQRRRNRARQLVVEEIPAGRAGRRRRIQLT